MGAARAMIPLADVVAACRYGVTTASRVHGKLRAAPTAALAAITGGGPTLVIAPHPDDESLGCGGLIAEACEQRQEVHVLVLTDGAASHPASRRFPPARLAALRENETREAVAALGLMPDHVAFLRLPDGGAPVAGRAARQVANRIAQHARERGIRAILTSWDRDTHADHQAAALLGRRAARVLKARIMFYPVWGLTLPPRRLLPAVPLHAVRLDVARHLPAKRQAIACHRSQVSGLIDDDPGGFQLRPEILELFLTDFETFIR
jgi:LmbE family N-acetylglucosaminyl deacetylase